MWASDNKLAAAYRRERGATMVEMAITSALFFVLVFAIFEMALLVFTWAKATEATRAAARYAIVSSPVTDISAIDCAASSSITVQCSGGNCDEIMDIVNGFLPDIAPANVEISYTCSSTGFPERPQSIAIRDVTVAFTGVTYEFILPNLLGLGADIEMPSFATTRTGEDLFTN